MKATHLAIATCVVLAATSNVAKADIVLLGATPAAAFIGLGAQGFGNAPRMLTLQTNTVETGSVTPVDVVHNDAVPGANKSTTPTLATLGWDKGADVGIGFNSDQNGGNGITMQSLTLTIYNGTSAVGSFSLASSLIPLTFTAADLAMQQGNGNAVFAFGLSSAQQTAFNTILSSPGSSGFTAGLGSQLGCPAGSPAGCLPSNDGPDSFLGFDRASVPDGGATLVLLGLGLMGLDFVKRRMKV